MRELGAMLYAVILANGSEQQVLEAELNFLDSILIAGGKDLEHLHGCLLAMGYVVERSLVCGRVSSNWNHLKKCVTNACQYLKIMYYPCSLRN